MKIVRAQWEERNFNCKTYEITLDRKDLESLDLLFSKLHSECFNDSYVTIKLPVGNLKALHALEDDGFRFMETQLFLVEHFEPLPFPNGISQWMESMVRTRVDKNREAWGRIIDRIVPGMFGTDRISLDPFLGPEIGCLRYKNWCWDLFENPNSWMWVLKIEDKEVSFGINIRNNETGVDDGVLGGVFPEYQGDGFGIFQIAGTKDRKIKNKTKVSSNNPKILRIFQNYGSIIYKELYVLRKVYG